MFFQHYRLIYSELRDATLRHKSPTMIREIFLGSQLIIKFTETELPFYKLDLQKKLYWTLGESLSIPVLILKLQELRARIERQGKQSASPLRAILYVF